MMQFTVQPTTPKPNKPSPPPLVVPCALADFVHLFPELIYKAPSTDYANRLCEMVLRQCDQSEETARRQATAFLYLLMRKNYVDEEYDNFTRIKVQTTLALSGVREQGVQRERERERERERDGGAECFGKS